MELVNLDASRILVYWSSRLHPSYQVADIVVTAGS